MAEGYLAIMASPQFSSVRDKHAKEMTVALARLLRIFAKSDDVPGFILNMEEHCVRPAMRLYEKLQVSTHHFYLDLNPYLFWGAAGGTGSDPQILASEDFYHHLDDFDCRNLVQNRKAVALAKMNPPPGLAELRRDMYNVCTVTPALYMRRVGRKDAIKEPILVRKQQMLVAYGSQEKRAKFMQGERTILNHIYHYKINDGFPGFRW